MIDQMLGGAIVMGLAVAGVFFLRFWKRTHDRLFLFFAAAFGLLAVNRLLVGMFDIVREEQSWVYVLRLVVFVFFFVAFLFLFVEAKRRS